ncbi:hypothetical protein [Oryzibacter oryziterrae]|uniref:hypothetical protein n=1 Tax=Oryzibacter oryziterrae TaxID=2766474 RepID=UPI001F478A2C|nr:hypothetical protein [Oryzibacter oryziterrae]
MSSDLITISLSRDEAVVLHEWLARVVDDENAEGIAETLEDDAEVWSLNAVLILLEQALDEPVDPAFEKLLKAARKRLRDKSGAWPWDASEDAGD